MLTPHPLSYALGTLYRSHKGCAGRVSGGAALTGFTRRRRAGLPRRVRHPPPHAPQVALSTARDAEWPCPSAPRVRLARMPLFGVLWSGGLHQWGLLRAGAFLAQVVVCGCAEQLEATRQLLPIA